MKVGGKWGVMDTEFLLVGNENVIRLNCVMVTQPWEYTKNY